MSQPYVTLNNGVAMPALGFGILNRDRPYLTVDAVRQALETGYRLVDTAANYNNEREVGEAIRSSGIDRSEVFLTTKLWIGHYGYEEALNGFSGSLRRLGLDYVDLYLLHWPYPLNFEATLASYKAAEKLLADGRVRAIGVSNFKPEHIERLLEHAGTVPAVNQIELHPFFAQKEARKTNLRHGIVTEAWAPLGNIVARNPVNATPGPLDHPLIAEIGKVHGRTNGQIILRWHLEKGVVAIPKSVTPERIRSNFDIFDFKLSVEELEALDALDTGSRFSRDPEIVDVETFPIKVID
ncbi:aldo/keto reductase [Rhizobium puerariae]|uniref:Aldo/keto reductase n=1 Tax=Rhizobium puerariae TaxID=1585791 RepID=A0ABV6AJD4_9HYPH